MNNSDKVYLIFHFDRLSCIKVSDLEPSGVLYEFLKSKNMVHLVSEFSVGIWGLYYGCMEDMHE